MNDPLHNPPIKTAPTPDSFQIIHRDGCGNETQFTLHLHSRAVHDLENIGKKFFPESTVDKALVGAVMAIAVAVEYPPVPIQRQIEGMLAYGRFRLASDEAWIDTSPPARPVKNA